MNRKLAHISHFCRSARIARVLALLFCTALYSKAANTVQVQLDTKEAKPRAVEALTEHGILRDYRFAWNSMAQALEHNSVDPLEGPFA
jgi:hypothetical protein